MLLHIVTLTQTNTCLEHISKYVTVDRATTFNVFVPTICPTIYFVLCRPCRWDIADGMEDWVSTTVPIYLSIEFEFQSKVIMEWGKRRWMTGVGGVGGSHVWCMALLECCVAILPSTVEGRVTKTPKGSIPYQMFSLQKSYIPVNWFLIIRVNSQSICMTTCLPFTYLIKLQLLPHANGSAFRRHRYNTHPLAHHIPDVHIVARAPNGHLIVRSLACSLHAPKMSDNEEENFTWICGNENITHRRHIGDGGFAEVHEVMWYCQVWLTMQMMDDLTGKVHTSTCRRY